MSLSCSCEVDDADWWYQPAEDFSLLGTKRARKCCSCEVRLAPGDEVLKFRRWKTAGYDTIEEKILGEGGEIDLADWFMCEPCGGLYLAFHDLGYCVSLGFDNMVELAKEYGEMQRAERAEAQRRRQTKWTGWQSPSGTT